MIAVHTVEPAWRAGRRTGRSGRPIARARQRTRREDRGVGPAPAAGALLDCATSVVPRRLGRVLTGRVRRRPRRRQPERGAAR
jgi:hypothetical protein